jgi:uncharacterized protein YoxC
MISTLIHLVLVMTSGMLFWTASLPVGISVLVLSIAATVASMISIRFGCRTKINAAVSPLQRTVTELEAGLEAVQRENTVLSEKLAACTEDSKRRRDSLGKLGGTLQIFDRTLPVLDALNKRVVSRTETSNIELSNRIFSIAELSKKLGGEIHQVMRGLLDGDSGLEREISELQSEVEGFQRLIGQLEGISSSYLRDMSTLKEAVHNIGTFTSALTDLADQTNLLSINASIEAARAGKAGSGFRIIATEVQNLARRSKTIAEEINSHILSAAETVEQSFAQQESTIGESIRQIRESQESLSGLSRNLRPQLDKVGATVEESRKLSGGVTDDLNGIIVSLQYHDIIRQILDHGISILGEIKSECLSEVPDTVNGTAPDEAVLQERVHEIAKRYFTVDDEWEVLGISVRDTSEMKEREDTKRRHQLEGDITLF